MILSFSPVFQKLQVVLQIRRECFRLVVFKNESSGKNQGGFFVVFFCVCGFFLVYFSPSHWLINTCLCIYKSQWNHQGKTFCMYKASWRSLKNTKACLFLIINPSPYESTRNEELWLVLSEMPAGKKGVHERRMTDASRPGEPAVWGHQAHAHPSLVCTVLSSEIPAAFREG